LRVACSGPLRRTWLADTLAGALAQHVIAGGADAGARDLVLRLMCCV
jgi:hypothetical protein